MRDVDLVALVAVVALVPGALEDLRTRRVRLARWQRRLVGGTGSHGHAMTLAYGATLLVWCAVVLALPALLGLVAAGAAVLLAAGLLILGRRGSGGADLWLYLAPLPTLDAVALLDPLGAVGLLVGIAVTGLIVVALRKRWHHRWPMWVLAPIAPAFGILASLAGSLAR